MGFWSYPHSLTHLMELLNTSMLWQFHSDILKNVSDRNSLKELRFTLPQDFSPRELERQDRAVLQCQKVHLLLWHWSGCRTHSLEPGWTWPLKISFLTFFLYIDFFFPWWFQSLQSNATVFYTIISALKENKSYISK